MKKVIMVGRIFKGYKVTLEKGQKYYCVTIDTYGSYESRGGIETLAEAKQIFREVIKEIEEY